jgi:hypothetical protein
MLDEGRPGIGDLPLGPAALDRATEQFAWVGLVSEDGAVQIPAQIGRDIVRLALDRTGVEQTEDRQVLGVFPGSPP